MTGRRRMILIVLSLSLGLGLALTAVEVFFRLTPRMIPAWYRQKLPAGGIELLQPGILEQTPVDGVPIPYGFDHRREILGGAPYDLELMGMVARTENPDRERYPVVRYRLDRFGFLNPREMERADLLLVGDSFVVAAGVLDPPGLQARLKQTTGLEVFNLAVPAIGPQRERWLLEEVGLELEPERVVWFFFGGNDLQEAARIEHHRQRRCESLADLYRVPLVPRSIAVDLLASPIRWLLDTRHAKTPLPGLRLPGGDGDQPVWFNPVYMRRLTRSRKAIAGSSGWSATTDVLLEVSKELKRRRIPLLVVYVPSKPQVYLPFVERDRDLLHRMASFDRDIRATPEGFLRSALAHRNDLDRLLAAFCRESSIGYRSLTPHFVRLARRGSLGYLAADTHWNEVGQAAALPVIRAWVEKTCDRGRRPRPSPVSGNGEPRAPLDDHDEGDIG